MPHDFLYHRVIVDRSRSQSRPPGKMQKQLKSAAQRQLVQSLLDLKAVEGHTTFRASSEFSAQELGALDKLAKKGWIKECSPQAWQLTKLPLQGLQINVVLHFPWNVFTRRSDIPMENATTFELLLALRGNGWNEQKAESVKKKHAHPPFRVGYLV